MRGVVLVMLALVAYGVGCTAAWSQTGASPTRAQYIQQADPICQATFSKRLPHGKGSKLKRAARGFAAISRHIATMANQLDALPKPTADIAVLGSWIAALRQFSASSNRLAIALRHGKAKRIRRALGALNRAQKLRLDTSNGYGFRICR